MMYRKTQQRVYMNRGDLKLQRRVLALICVVLLAAVVSLVIVLLNKNGLESKATREIHNRMYITYNSAYDVASRMNSATAKSDQVAQTAMIQQYVYYMEQLNELNNALFSSRLTAPELYMALKSDLTSLTSLINQGTSTTQDVRTDLLNHLSDLGAALDAVLNIDAPR